LAFFGEFGGGLDSGGACADHRHHRAGMNRGHRRTQLLGVLQIRDG